MAGLLKKREIAVPVRCVTLHEARLAILNEAALSLAPEAVENFIAVIDSPASPMPNKLANRLSRKVLWDGSSA